MCKLHKIIYCYYNIFKTGYFNFSINDMLLIYIDLVQKELISSQLCYSIMSDIVDLIDLEGLSCILSDMQRLILQLKKYRLHNYDIARILSISNHQVEHEIEETYETVKNSLRIKNIN